MATVNEVTYELLRARGLTTIFGNPGSNELPFLDGMPTDFVYILGLHEGAVMSMAEGYSLACNKPAFVNLHAAAGSGNAIGALTNAVYSHSPLVISAGQQVRPMVGQEVLLANVEAVNLPKPLVKWSCEPVCAQDVPRVFNQAIHTATLPPKGPVYVSVPYDDWGEDADPQSLHVLARQVTAAGGLSEAQLAVIVEALEAATNPVLVLGPDVDAAHANDDAVVLAEKLRAPVWIAPSPSRCPFPTRHRSFRGVLPAGVGDISALLSGHDLVVVIGAPVFRYHQYVPGPYLPVGARLLHLTCDPGEAARAPMGEAVLVDIRDSLARIARSVNTSDRDTLPALPDIADPQTGDRRWMHPDEVFALLRMHAPRDAVYIEESPSTSTSFWSQMDLACRSSYFSPAAGGLGFGVPAAVGAQLAHQNRQVIGVVGDGSANYGITALWTAAHHNVPVIIVILKNGAYEALHSFAMVLQTPNAPGLDIPGIDFVAIAQGYGVQATAARNPDDFVLALTNALASAEPTLIEVITAAGRKEPIDGST